MLEIIPALMEEDAEALEDALARVRGVASTVQLDVMDGMFVPNLSFPYVARGRMVELEALPRWQDFNFEFDLMIKDPARDLGRLLEMGPARVVLHAESGGMDVLKRCIDAARKMDVEVGIAADNSTSPVALEAFIPEVDFVQVMGIARIGFQGEPFDERALARVRELRERHPDLIISVDGSVNEATALALAKAGASRLVVGSALWQSDDPKALIASLAALSPNS